MPPDERPREKLLGRGPAALTDPELLAILLRTGLPGCNAVEVARQLLQRSGSLSGLSRCTVQEIASVRGIGTAKAIQLVAGADVQTVRFSAHTSRIVRMTVTGVARGSKYNDLCLSEGTFGE